MGQLFKHIARLLQLALGSLGELAAGAQAGVNKACDGTSAREVWEPSWMEGRGSLRRCQAATLFAGLPESSPASPRPPLRLHLLRRNLLPPFTFFRHLVSREEVEGCRCRRSATGESARSNHRPPPQEDNPRLKQTFTENCLFLPLPYKYFSITCRHLGAVLIPH